ncbi:three-Cys-motif partner protein TcmP [Streptomyces sp. Isolate_45]|uniref:three-Cys-motif partner protein TcmP n=1 Tax=Streptomyces sp. Isolate_45 TaxID=2950111 RepID=UPI002481BC2B|nr:three-Cys-motif partner protein TcmP [Streptomyces sp. Isolate_45]MDA5286324.1 three-Cys-motif partner protein TcmP [Streptomyces sp. Isolate_45]
MGVLWTLEPATAAKHRLYQRYLDAWWPILLQTSQKTGYSRPRVTLLDAFAGPGRYEGGAPGSPVFILDRLLHHHAVDRMNLSPRRVHLVFIERTGLATNTCSASCTPGSAHSRTFRCG